MNILMICIIITIFIFHILFINIKKYNKIKKTYNINIKYINEKDIQIEKYLDRYISFMNKFNLLARNCQSTNDLLNKYKNAYDIITDNEKIHLHNIILNLLSQIKKNNISYHNYIIYWINNIYIIKSKSWLESNMPHTMSNIIIMHKEWFIKPTMNILLHEITHIHQRLYPNDFIDLYTELGYIYYDINKILNKHHILSLNRNNPDGIDINWLWKSPNNNIWWIGAVFTSTMPKNLHDIYYIAIQIYTNNNNDLYFSNDYILLNKLTEFIDYFGIYNDNYHPNELCSMYAEWYLDEIINNNSNKNKYIGYNVYKKYYCKIIKKYY